MKKINFYKISAAGNDFIMIDNRKKVMPKNVAAVAQKLCHRQFSIGADGLILLEPSKTSNFRMRYYNADGSAAAMCGNGGRSVVRFAHLLGAAPKKMAFETDAGIEKREFDASFINTGVPHVVIYVSGIEKLDVASLGRMIRFHRQFAPEGANVNFVQRKDEHTIIVRTYERGVEGETLACGTGVTASAIISGLKKLVKPPVNCITRGGDTLTVSYAINDASDFLSPVSNVYLEGPAVVSFTGEVEI
jgi:diaminopimelate epimerase